MPPERLPSPGCGKCTMTDEKKHLTTRDGQFVSDEYDLPPPTTTAERYRAWGFLKKNGNMFRASYC